MIGRIRGILIYKKPPLLMVDVGGIGYELEMPINSFHLLPPLGDEVVLQTHFLVREDAHQLFAFTDEKQKILFRNLIKVNGIGPKLALTILSGTETDILIYSIREGDDSRLISLPGVGKKIAQRLIMELRGKLENLPELEISIAEKAESDTTIRDAISALIALGYKPGEAHRAVSAHRGKNLSSEEVIRLALKDKK